MSSSNERLLKGLQEEFNKIKAKEPKDVTLDLSDPMTFVENYVKLPEKAPPTQKTWFEQRPWLSEIYRDEHKRIVIVKGRQMEVSEYAVNMLFYWAAKWPGKYIYASSSGDKADVFSHDRYQKQLSRSPTLQALVRDEAVRRVQYAKSEVYFMTAYEDTKTLRSIDADGIILDEFQDYRANAIPIAEEGLAHSSLKRLWVIGTPYLTGTNFSSKWDESTKKEWNKEKQIWEVTNPKSDGMWQGYHISQEMAVGLWLTPEEFEYRRAHKPTQEFWNECLGLFYAGLGRPTDYGYMSSLFSPALMKGQFGKGDLLILGVDWGISKSNTVFYLIRPRLLELPDIYTIDTLYIEKVQNPDITKQIARVAQLLTTFPTVINVFDYGTGFVQNQELYKQFGSRVMQVELGSGKLGKPLVVEQTAFGQIAKVNRTWAIDTAMDYVTKPDRFRLYNETDKMTKDWIIKDFLAEYPETSQSTGKKIWIHSSDATDDCLIAFVNAMIGFQIQKSAAMPERVEDMISFV